MDTASSTISGLRILPCLRQHHLSRSLNCRHPAFVAPVPLRCHSRLGRSIAQFDTGHSKVCCHSASANSPLSSTDEVTPDSALQHERWSPLQRLQKFLTSVWQAVLLIFKGILSRIFAPRPANMAEARGEAQQKLQEQKSLGGKQSKEYKMALARTRQHVSIRKALQLQRQGFPSRAEVELQRALSENSICRAPLLAANYTEEQMLGLYKLHLENTELPPNYAQLLQLQDMLDLDARQAEQLEADVMSNPAAFSI